MRPFVFLFPESMKYTQLFEQAYSYIAQSSAITLACHEHPDGDALGSLAALGMVAERHFGKQTLWYSADGVPLSLAFLPGSERIVSDLSQQADLLIGLDYADFWRLKVPARYVAEARMLTIDHHPWRGQQGNVCIIDPSCSSTAELIYWFLQYHGIPIDADVARCLLTGIITDSGGFLHANTSARTMFAAAELMRKGADAAHIFEELGKYEPRAVRATGHILARAQTHSECPGMFYAGIPFKEFEMYNVASSDLFGVTDMLNAAEGTKFCAFLIEYEKGRVKGSLRSEPHKGVDVSAIAEALGGGGHKYAAGFSFMGSLQEAEGHLVRTANSVLV